MNNRGSLADSADVPAPEAGAQADPHSDGLSRLAAILIAGAMLCLVATGALLWSARGGAVFNDLVSAAVAWCF